MEYLKLYFDGNRYGNGQEKFLAPETTFRVRAESLNGAVLLFDREGRLSHSVKSTYAEYLALQQGLEHLIRIRDGNPAGIDLQIYGDCQPVIYQLKGYVRCRKEYIRRINVRIRVLLAGFARWEANWLPRELNPVT